MLMKMMKKVLKFIIMIKNIKIKLIQINLGMKISMKILKMIAKVRKGK